MLQPNSKSPTHRTGKAVHKARHIEEVRKNEGGDSASGSGATSSYGWNLSVNPWSKVVEAFLFVPPVQPVGGRRDSVLTKPVSDRLSLSTIIIPWLLPERTFGLRFEGGRLSCGYRCSHL